MAFSKAWHWRPCVANSKDFWARATAKAWEPSSSTPLWSPTCFPPAMAPGNDAMAKVFRLCIALSKMRPARCFCSQSSTAAAESCKSFCCSGPSRSTPAAWPSNTASCKNSPTPCSAAILRIDQARSRQRRDKARTAFSRRALPISKPACPHKSRASCPPSSACSNKATRCPTSRSCSATSQTCANCLADLCSAAAASRAVTTAFDFNSLRSPFAVWNSDRRPPMEPARDTADSNSGMLRLATAAESLALRFRIRSGSLLLTSYKDLPEVLGTPLPVLAPLPPPSWRCCRGAEDGRGRSSSRASFA
mmetsp:Transcript_63065/g.138731  ORF Transcript_63065/g.138731 Transcript_63065/m.138731 type:complete len:306 (-) Transcript_63065:150-1067(-)